MQSLTTLWFSCLYQLEISFTCIIVVFDLFFSLAFYTCILYQSSTFDKFPKYFIVCVYFKCFAFETRTFTEDYTYFSPVNEM